MTSILELKEGLEQQLRQESYKANLGRGENPEFPLYLLFLGEGLENRYESVRQDLLTVWPAFREELHFLQIKIEGEGYSYYHYVNGEMLSISKTELRDLIGSSFDTRQAHFSSFNNLLLYVFLETRQLHNFSEFQTWMHIMGEVKNDFRFVVSNQLTTSLFLLTEPIHQPTQLTNSIRNELVAYVDNQPSLVDFSSVYLLSNVCDNGTIITDLLQIYSALSSLIVFTNSQLGISQITQRKVKTLSHLKLEKPFAAIAQSILVSFLELVSPVWKKLKTDGNLDWAELFGLQKGAFRHIENQIGSISNLLPTPEQLEYFPRMDVEDYDPLSRFTARKFESLCMGSGRAYIEELIVDKLGKDQLEAYGQSYYKEHYPTLTSQQLLAFSRMMDPTLVHQELEKEIIKPSMDLDILTYLQNLFWYQLFNSTLVKTQVIDALTSWTDQILQFQEEFDTLLNSQYQLHAVKDLDVEQYYKKLVENDWSRNSEDNNAGFRKVKSMEEYLAFMQSFISCLFSNNEIFIKSFEEELASRWQDRPDYQIADVHNSVYQQFGNQVTPIMMSGAAGTYQMACSALLMKEDTAVANYLKEQFTNSKTYYNTGDGSSIVSMIIYNVENYHLIAGEEDYV
ncbi:hypothetical protein [Streptococcus suis]|uniref:hypothetical protein n=1 Tax=Streptococcus suis TaxID=1307 RepID=UPI001C9385CB|nr:hypothetical protein [Streptococcus suis]MBY4970277.1 hypothetical protein [Streptococcus suis]HEL9636496.1 hypothetical protein [Streptococcus suis]